MTTMVRHRFVMALGLAAFALGCSGSSDDELEWPSSGETAKAAEPVHAYYDSFNDHSFAPASFMTKDWNVVAPRGKWFQGKKESVAGLDQLLLTEAKGVRLAPRDLALTFVTDDVALAVVTSHASRAGEPRQGLRASFVLVARDGVWSVAQTHETFVAATGVTSEGSGSEPSKEVGGPATTEDERAAGVRETMSYFQSLAVTRDFDHFADYTTESVTGIAPSGFWFRGRAALEKEDRAVTGSFLKDVVVTPLETSLRFLTDDVALVTELSDMSPFANAEPGDQTHTQSVASSLLVNHDGRWLLEYSHTTLVDPTP